ncbi:MAG: metallophosphoesterase [bacterium]
MTRIDLSIRPTVFVSLFVALQLYSFHLAAQPSESAAPREHDEFRFSGEYGLWVQEQENQIDVHWITAATDSGFLRVLSADKSLADFTTPLSLTHQVSFDKPKVGVFALHYGSLSNPFDNHKTVIRLPAKRPGAIFGKVDSIYVIGDLHGEFHHLVELLSNARLIDANLDWIARKKHLVLLGDFFDRGIHVTKTLWLLYKLDRQAELAGGRVHLVLGNHEIMTFGNDLRYLAPKEQMISHLHRIPYSQMYDVHRSVLGKWLATKPGLIKMDKILFAHGGVAPLYANYSIEVFNDSLQKFINEETFAYLLQDSIPAMKIDSLSYYRRLHFFYGETSVFWHRDYVLTDRLEKDLKKVLRTYRCKTHIIAHTTVKTISEFYDGKIIAVDLMKPATEMLLLVRKGKHKKFRVHLDGTVEKLEKRANVAATQ